MKHKIKVWKGRHVHTRDRWYVSCLAHCGEIMPAVDGSGIVGRETWDAAFAIGLAHQNDAEVAQIIRDVKGRFASPRKSHNVHNCDSRCW